MADGTVQFDAATHTYTVGGARVPSVTGIIAPLVDYSMVKEELLALAAERGDAVHKACELDDLEDLEESSIDPRIAGYLAAWRRFRLDTGFVPTAIEAIVRHPAQGFAGTLDRVGLLRKQRWVLEIKSVSTLLPATAVQTAGYAMAWNAEHPDERVEGRCAVKLGPDGDYRLQRYTDHNDYPTFSALLTVRRWQERNHK